jgi:hypothetical protein
VLLFSAGCSLILVLVFSGAHIAPRIPLVIGNQAYATDADSRTTPVRVVRAVGAACARVAFAALAAPQDATSYRGAAHDFASRLHATGPDAVGMRYRRGRASGAGFRRQQG